MRLLTLLLAGCLVLIVGQAAPAFTLTGYTSGDPLSVHFNGLDVGPVYAYGTYDTQAACDAATIAAAPKTLLPGEDAWGIANVSNITDPTNTVTYWSAATSPTELTALFVGINDQSARRVAVAGGAYDEITSYSTNFKFFLWEGPSTGATAYNPTGGPSARTGLYTYPTVTDGTLLLEASGVNGYWNPLANGGRGAWVEHKAVVDLTYDTLGNVTSVTGGNGHAFAVVDDANGDGTTDGLGFSNGLITTQNPAVMADIQLDWTLTLPESPAHGWNLAVQDPVGMRFVPEPATMALLTLGGLGILLRRKQK
jgi:hypothetical protein